jgi:hypothetical protein
VEKVGPKQSVWRLVQDSDKGDGSCLGNMFDFTLPDSLGIVVYQDHYGGHYRKENSYPCNDAVEVQTPKSEWCSLALDELEYQRGELGCG